PVHGLARAGEVGVAAGDDAHVPAVGRRVVVERRRVRQAISFASAYHAERVVCGDRPLQDAQRRAVQRGVDHGTLAGPPRIARVQRRDRRVRGEEAGEVVRDGDADTHGRAIRVAGQLEYAAVPDAHAVEPGA